MNTLTLKLPWPPSNNHYYRNVRNRTIISKAGRDYRERIAALCTDAPRFGSRRLRVSLVACVPDRRRRDLDNILKCVQDSLQKSGIYDDDSQIDDLRIVRGPLAREAGGVVLVTINAIPTKEQQ